ncbi:DUF805 domain-containing protein [Galactobacter valiniphilus]|uniref:DUF805 domain-containing protein n=1 Tax=Galactobacter valiniphilus TaxID=2676122 RepID=UPI0037356D84
MPYAQPYAVTPGYSEARDAADPNDLTLPLRRASFGQAIKRFFKNYAGFDGRASQSEFLWVQLAAFLVYLVFGFAARALELGEDPFVKGPDTNPFTVFLIIGIVAFSLGTIVPHLALTWRRLHDTDLSGALWCISFVPYLGSLVVFILCCLNPKPRGARFDVVNR